MLASACSGSPRGDTDAGQPLDAADNSADGGPPPTVPPGRIDVRPFNWGKLYLNAAFHDAPEPERRTEVQRSGDCRLMAYTPSLCDPACRSLHYCVDQQCIPYPSRLDKGLLQWSWPGGSIEVIPDSYNTYAAEGAFSDHGSVEVGLLGETLTADTQPDPAALEDWSQQLLAHSGDVTLRWSNPVAGARVRLHMTDCSGSHGGIGEYEIQCDAPDIGSITIEGAFLERLDQGNWSRGECGSHEVIRYTTDTTEDGQIGLEVQSGLSFYYRPNDPTPATTD